MGRDIRIVRAVRGAGEMRAMRAARARGIGCRKVDISRFAWARSRRRQGLPPDLAREHSSLPSPVKWACGRVPG